MLAVDDQPQFRRAIRRLIERSTALVVVAEAASGEAAVKAVRELEPDLVLMDVRMPGVGGIAATRAIKRIRPKTVVLLVSSTPPDELPRHADECLADAIVWKGDLCPRLLDEVWAKHDGRNSGPPRGARPKRQ